MSWSEEVSALNAFCEENGISQLDFDGQYLSFRKDGTEIATCTWMDLNLGKTPGMVLDELKELI